MLVVEILMLTTSALLQYYIFKKLKYLGCFEELLDIIFRGE